MCKAGQADLFHSGFLSHFLFSAVSDFRFVSRLLHRILVGKLAHERDSFWSNPSVALSRSAMLREYDVGGKNDATWIPRPLIVLRETLEQVPKPLFPLKAVGMYWGGPPHLICLYFCMLLLFRVLCRYVMRVFLHHRDSLRFVSVWLCIVYRCL